LNKKYLTSSLGSVLVQHLMEK